MSYQSAAPITVNLTTIDVGPNNDIHYNHTNTQILLHKLSHYYQYVLAISCCLLCILLGYYMGHSTELRYIPYSRYNDDSTYTYDIHGRYDNPLISAKDFATSTLSPTRYTPTTHIIGTTEAIYEQYIPILPTLFPVLRLAPTVQKKCTSELPLVELDHINNTANTVNTHDSKHTKHNQPHTYDNIDITDYTEYTTLVFHEHNNDRHHHHHHRRSHHKHDSHGKHSDHHIYHGHDDSSHHHHEQSIDSLHSEHHHTIRDDDHTHNKYVFDDDTLDDIPPPTRRFHWCFNCSDRCSNVVRAIEFQARNNDPRDTAMKFSEMSASLPRFFRGVDHLYLEDVFNLPYDSEYFQYSTQRTRTFVSADQHLYNYGTFDNNIGEIVYDMNDFDQTLIDNYHVDLWRTATSLVTHMRINEINIEEQRRVLYDFASTYYTTVASFVGNDNELYAYLHSNNTEGAVYETVYLAQHSNTRGTLLDSLCYYDSNHIRRLDDSGAVSLEPVTHKIYDEIVYYWPRYLESLGTIHRNSSHVNHTAWHGIWQQHNVSVTDYFKIKSIAARVGAGLGSLGVPRYYVLVEGLSDSQDDDIILDVKYEPVPEWWNFVHDDVRTLNGHFLSQGHRIAAGIHALSSRVDTHCGWMDMQDGSYLIRSRSPYKAQVDIDALISPIRFHSFAMHLAIVNAIAHSRADNDYKSELIQWSFEEELVGIVGSDIDGFAQILTDYAFMNADRIADDYNCFIESGIVENAHKHSLDTYTL